MSIREMGAFFKFLSVLLALSSALVIATHSETLYFSNVADIQQLLTDGRATVVFSDPEIGLSLDCNDCDRKIYWADLSGKIKRGIPHNASSVETIISEDLVNPRGLAVDWRGNVVYFSQRGVAPSSGRVEVASCDGRHRRVLLVGLINAGPLAINAVTGHLYYVDYTSIRRIHLDGTHSELIYSDNSVDISTGISGLAVDASNHLLFWSRGGDNKVVVYLNLTEILELPENDRSSVAAMVISNTNQSKPYEVAVFNNTLYWTELPVSGVAHSQGALYSLDMESQNLSVLIRNDTISPHDVCTFEDMPLLQDGCAVANGGCELFCFTVPSGLPEGGTRPQCACPTGILLGDDGYSCSEFPNNFLLFVQVFGSSESGSFSKSHIRQISLDVPVPPFIDVQLPIDISDKEAVFLGYDSIHHYVYWTEHDPPAIKRATLDGSVQEIVVNTGIRRPEGIAVDSFHGNLYWADSALNRIEVMALPDVSGGGGGGGVAIGGSRRVLFDTNLDHPQGLALDIDRGLMYWTDLDSSHPRIERARMDGTQRQVLPTMPGEVKLPANVAVDPRTGVVYWSEVHDSLEDIMRFDPALDDHAPLGLRTNINDVLGLAVCGNWLYWADRSPAPVAIGRADNSDGRSVQPVVSGVSGIRGILAVNSSIIAMDTLCLALGCSHLCLPNGFFSVTCACPDHFTLGSDERQCTDAEAKVYMATSTAPPDSLFVIRVTNNDRWSTATPTEVLAGSNALSLSVDVKGEAVYWIHRESKKIYRHTTSDLSLSTPELVIGCCLETPSDLAVDWFGGNLYVADPEERVIEVAKISGSLPSTSRTVFARFPESLGGPQHIVVDPLRSGLFWSPPAAAKIYRMSMSNGSQLTEFWSGAASETVVAMVIQYSAQDGVDVLYWAVTSGGSSTVYSRSLVSGADHSVLSVDDKTLLNIATLGDNLYLHYVQQVGTFTTDIITIARTQNSFQFFFAISGITDFEIFHPSLQPSAHECGVNNRDCGGRAMCLVASGYEGVCQCPPTTATQMQRDNRTGVETLLCITPESFLLIATSEAVHYLPVPDNDHVAEATPLPLPLGPLGNLTAMTYDPVNHSVLWVDQHTQHLHSALLDLTGKEDLVHLHDLQPFSLAYDHIGGHVFITEKQGFQIELLTVNGGGRGSLLDIRDAMRRTGSLVLDRPGDLAFDSDANLLYWTDREPSSGLGEHLFFLPLSNLSNIGSVNITGRKIDKLTFEPSTGALYWVNRANMTNATIERYLDRSFSVVAAYASDVTALAAMQVGTEHHVFWYNASDHALYRYTGGPAPPSLYQHWTAPSPIVAFLGHRTDSVRTSLSCLSQPRPCSHLCVHPSSNAGHQCLCPANTQLTSQTQCSEPSCGPLQFACGDDFSECFPNSYFCDGIRHCGNGFDEICNCDTSQSFACSDNTTCLGQHQRCDGRSDCPLGEDEAECCLSNEPLGCYVQVSDGGRQVQAYDCLKEGKRCNGVDDCIDGSDEEDNCDLQSPTRPPSPTTKPNISRTTIAAVAVCVGAVLALIFIVFCIIGFMRMLIQKKSYRLQSGGSSRSNNLSLSYKSSNSPPLDSMSEFNSEVSGGTHTTRLGSNLSPSADSSSKMLSAAGFSTHPVNPPPSLCTYRHPESIFSENYSTISQSFNFPDIPPAPAPSINYDYDALSAMSMSVSQKNVPGAINGIHDPHSATGAAPNSYQTNGNARNPLYNAPGSHAPHHPHHTPVNSFSRPSRHHHPPPRNVYHHQFGPATHYAPAPSLRSAVTERDTESEDTISMTTMNTDNQEVYRYDDIPRPPPPGRPPSPATEVSEYPDHHGHHHHHDNCSTPGSSDISDGEYQT